MKFAKYLRTPFFTEHHQWLLLKNRLQRNYEISLVYNDKGNRTKKKKIGKRMHDLGWRMPAATTRTLIDETLMKDVFNVVVK